MVEMSDGSFRAWLGLELGGEDRRAIERWLNGAFDPDSITVAEGSELVVRVAALAGRRPQALRDLARGLAGLEPLPVGVEFEPAVRAVPSRQRPNLYVLPARCHGLAEALNGLAACAVRAAQASPYLVVGRARSGLQAPGRRPPDVPESLRGPIGAVRLGLYCSQITPERNRLDPLAQVKLPMAAAVR